MRLQSFLAPKDPHEPTSIIKHADGTPDGLSRLDSHFKCEEEFDRIVVTGKFPQGHLDPSVLVETIRDPEDPSLAAFLHWKGGKPTILHEIRHSGQILLPPDLTADSFPDLSLPNRLLTCNGSAELLAQISATIANFVILRPDQLRIVAAFVLASWFPDCFEAAPYLFIVGPLGSGKTKLLKLLRCLCRRGLIVGDIRSGSLYKLIDDWNPTLIIDELDLGNSGESADCSVYFALALFPEFQQFETAFDFRHMAQKLFLPANLSAMQPWLVADWSYPCCRCNRKLSPLTKRPCKSLKTSSSPSCACCG